MNPLSEQHGESKAFGENTCKKILKLEAQIQAMRVAKETLNLELKRSWGRCQTC
jgi:hypothetical protein